MKILGSVASFTDAWIETYCDPKQQQTRRMSHLLQMRGLKPGGKKYIEQGVEVASFTDAWIETRPSCLSNCIVNVASFTDAWIETCNKQKMVNGKVCRIFYSCLDLYLWFSGNRKVPLVASFTDAWIETDRHSSNDNEGTVASFTDAWIETADRHPVCCPHLRRIFYRCVD